jgi:lysophospholipase L1-like esterase
MSSFTKLLPAAAAPTIAEQLIELRREAATRARLYPTWIAAGKLMPSYAARQEARLHAAIRTLEGLLPDAAAPDAPAPQPRLPYTNE